MLTPDSEVGLKLDRRGLLRIVIGPLVGYFVWAMFRLSIGIIIPPVMSEYDLVEAEGGALLSSVLGAMGSVMFVGGYLSDRVGKRVTMSVGLTLMAAGILLGGYLNGYGSLLLSMFVAGLGAGLFSAALHAFAGDILPTSRGGLVGLTNSFYALGGFLGPWLSAIVVLRSGWRSFFYLMSVVGFAIAAALWQSSRKESRGKRVHEFQGAYRGLLRNRAIASLCLSMSFANFAFVSFAVWAPSYLVKAMGFSLSEAGFSFGLYSLTGALGATFFGFLSDRVGRKRSMTASGILLFALSLLFFSGYVTSKGLIALSGVVGFAAFAYWNLTISSAQDYVGEALTGSVTGLIQSVGLIVAVAAPVISGFMISDYGFHLALILSTALPTLIYATIASLIPSSPSRVATVGT